MLSIIIVSYNVKYFLGQCLSSVMKAANGIEAEIIVIDNNSTDGSVDHLAAHFPEVRVIANNENRGFSCANNQGWQIAQGAFVLFLNPDTLLCEDCLTLSLAVFKERPKVGALGIRMIDGSGKYLAESKRGLPAPAAAFYKLSGMARLFPHSRRFASYYLGHLSEEQDQEVAVLAGAFIMVRMEVLRSTGGFDEQFFMYGEDVDLSYRIQQEGYTNYYLAQSTIIHFKGESTRKDFKYVYMFYKAMHQFVKKHYHSHTNWFEICLRLAIWFRATLSFFAKLFSPSPTRTKKRPPVQCLIIGTEKEQSAVKEILKKYRKSSQEPMGITVEKFSPELFSIANTNELIFCCGTLCYRKIVKMMQELPRGIGYKFYSPWTGSIVGSNFKDSSGEAMI